MAVFQTLIAITYPALVYFGLTVMEPREVALCAGGALLLRTLVIAPARLRAYVRSFWLPVAVVVMTVVVAGASNHPLALLMTPVFINLGLLGTFAASLLQTESLVERIAKVQAPELSKEELAYCRRVTMVWCGFFVMNAAISLALALRGNLGAWAVYTGAVSYVLIGMLFAGEYVYRHWRFRRYLGAPGDAVLEWLFPPRRPSVTGNPLDPQLLEERSGPGFIHLDLQVPADLSVWPGHFPEYFIVPGFLQLRWVTMCAQRLVGDLGELRSVEELKFKAPLLPGRKFEMRVEKSDRGARQFRFRLTDGDDVFSSGRLLLGNEGSS